MERSPQAAAAHDRPGWVGLFTGDGRVEDPVGSRPHTGPAEIGRFYDTFIGPRDIAFHRDLDIVRGSSVIRDLELEVAMGSAVTMTFRPSCATTCVRSTVTGRSRRCARTGSCPR